MRTKIRTVKAIEVLDSRGNPTAEATVVLDSGATGSASVPSGASRGEYEAFELRDGDSGRYNGNGVLNAVGNVNGVIAGELCGTAADIYTVDKRLCGLDSSPNKSNLGANAILAVSLANARACARNSGAPLFRYLGGECAVRLPVPMLNILNGGVHAGNSIDIQEFMIVPDGFDSFAESLRAASEIYHTLKKLLNGYGFITAVGDEGGFAPDIASTEEVLDMMCLSIEKAGYSTDQVHLAIDAASSGWKRENGYHMSKSGSDYTSDELIRYWKKLCRTYPVMSLEDGLSEDDIFGWVKLTDELSDKVMLVGDDLFVTDTKRLEAGADAGAGNTVLVKPNQIGTLTETLDFMRSAKRRGYRTVMSHRSGETEDTSIADIAVAAGADYIKSGAPQRSERCAKYNRLLKIASSLTYSEYAGKSSAAPAIRAFSYIDTKTEV